MRRLQWSDDPSRAALPAFHYAILMRAQHKREMIRSSDSSGYSATPCPWGATGPVGHRGIEASRHSQHAVQLMRGTMQTVGSWGSSVFITTHGQATKGPTPHMQPTAAHAEKQRRPMQVFSASLYASSNIRCRTHNVSCALFSTIVHQHHVNTGFFALTISSRSTMTRLRFPSRSSFAA